MGNRRWTIEEIDFLKDNWGNMQIKTIAKKLDRTESAITCRAIRNEKLGAFLDSCNDVLFSRVLKEIGNWNNSLHKIASVWDNLKVTKKIIQKQKIYTVKIKDFWKFAEKYQDKLNFARFEKNSLGIEPKWVDKKRREDVKKSLKAINKHKKWTKNDLSLVKSYLKLKYTHKEIAKIMGRTTKTISKFIIDNNLSNPNCKWEKADIEKLFELRSKGLTYKEIAVELNRDYKSVKNKYYRSIDNKLAL